MIDKYKDLLESFGEMRYDVLIIVKNLKLQNKQNSLLLVVAFML